MNNRRINPLDPIKPKPVAFVQTEEMREQQRIKERRRDRIMRIWENRPAEERGLSYTEWLEFQLEDRL
jgi:hypothetical protein